MGQEWRGQRKGEIDRGGRGLYDEGGEENRDGQKKGEMERRWRRWRGVEKDGVVSDTPF